MQATREHLIHQYGTLSGKKVTHDPNVYAIERIIEKPTPTQAELHLHVPGLRAGHYLCFFGMHVLTSRVFEMLDEQVVTSRSRGEADRGPIPLTNALDTLAREQKYLAIETRDSPQYRCQIRVRGCTDRAGVGGGGSRADAEWFAGIDCQVRAELMAVLDRFSASKWGSTSVGVVLD